MSDYDNRLSDYVDVPARIAEFRAKYPDGSLQPWNADEPFRVEKIGEKTFVVVVAAAYRTADDKRPGVGMAYEQFPGRTPYTRDSELQNAETSAWGRAIVAALAADTKRSVASMEEVRNRIADREVDERPPGWDPETQVLIDAFMDEIRKAKNDEDIATVGTSVAAAKTKGELPKAAYGRLARAAAARKAELNGGPKK